MAMIQGMRIETLAMAFLAAMAALGVAYVFIYPLLSGEARAEKRQQAIQGQSPQKAKRGARTVEVNKREQVQQSLKEQERRQKRAKSPPLRIRIEQAGLTWSVRAFIVISVICGLLSGAGVFFLSHAPLIALGAAFVGGLGLPRWYLSFKKKKRLGKFIEEFPNALDVITRGVRAGLPLGDCLRIIASEAADPVRGEFRVVVETQALGLSLGEATAKIYERMPCAEANFFGIVIAIQQKAGGNLAESLSNLSKVLRERKKMRAKIKAVSTEAKASAMIIGSLPIIVTLLVYLTTPAYITTLWITGTGQMLMVISGFWMACGIAVMKKMINFDI